MTAVTKLKTDGEGKKPTGLDLLRAPFQPHQISKLPKPTKRQTEEVRNDFKKGVRCHLCGQWHHPKVQHLDYVGHAALTDRLLDCDPQWNWEPLAFTEQGTPALDENGGMWIRLTVCGVTRYGYGHPDGKRGGDAIKEVIGDALRNAAMRFGAALDLWHKGTLHPDAEQAVESDQEGDEQERSMEFQPRAAADRIITKLRKASSMDDLSSTWAEERDAIANIKGADREIYAEVEREKNQRKAKLNEQPIPAGDALEGDEIPY